MLIGVRKNNDVLSAADLNVLPEHWLALPPSSQRPVCAGPEWSAE